MKRNAIKCEFFFCSLYCQNLKHFAYYRDDYQKISSQPSQNMDDTGYFSVQVISKSLSLWSMELININSTDRISTETREQPTKARAFILNMENHWYCIRRFTCHPTLRHPSNEPFAFFNLDSLLSRPEYMSSTFLTEYLKQMQNDGYSVFVVTGEFPECEAEPIRYEPNQHRATNVIDLSQSESNSSISEQYSNKNDSVDDPDLDAAIKLSLDSGTTSSECLSPGQLREKRLAYFCGKSALDK